MALEKRENAVLRQLRMYLRNVLHRLQREVKYRVFATAGMCRGDESTVTQCTRHIANILHPCACRAESYEDLEDYFEIVKNPMDLDRIMERLERGRKVQVCKGWGHSCG